MSPKPVAGEIAFPDGLPGFEGARQFVLVVAPELGPFTMVQGIGEGAPAFLAIDPRRVEARYDECVATRDLGRLGAAAGDALLWLALVSVSPDGTPTVNLKAPLVICPATMRGVQVVRDDPAYLISYPLEAA
jgi:flagellar assembly factor FliW